MNTYSVYRVQAEDGRGPFRPGLTRYWADDEPRAQALAPWYESISVADLHTRLKRGQSAGCACESMDDLSFWFSEQELLRLKRIGYRVVTLALTPESILYHLPQSRQVIVVLPRSKQSNEDNYRGAR